MSDSTPIYHPETKELLGAVREAPAGWTAETIFGYVIERTTSEQAAERVVRSQGSSYLGGVWHYYDKDDSEWFPCVIKEAHEHKVVVIRTNAMGYQSPDDFKLVVLEHPSEQHLTKS